MENYYTSAGKLVSLKKQIQSGGEGAIWETDKKGYLAKIYYSFNGQRANKLEVMVANPPENLSNHKNHIAIAWPTDLLKDKYGYCVGFLMPAIQDSVDLINIYNPTLRQQTLPGFNWRYLHVTAQNLAWIIQAIHAKGYVLGDIKPQNLLVNNRALVSVVDTDSFQIRHPSTGLVYRCPVGSPEYTPPELIGKDLSTVDQNKSQDYFRLAVIIYLLLFSYHPFSTGKWKDSGEEPKLNELILQGLWPFGNKKKDIWPFGKVSLIEPGPLTISLNVLHPELKRCFLRCFNDGHDNPYSRPTAKDWSAALQLAIADLTDCNLVSNHVYSKTYGNCHWCDRAENLNYDVFGPVSFSPNYNLLLKILFATLIVGLCIYLIRTLLVLPLG